MLPRFDEEKYSLYVEDKKKGLDEEKREKHWYNNYMLIGAIGELWTAFKIFYQYNNYKLFMF